MIFVFTFFAALLVWFSIQALRGGIRYLRYFRAELIKPLSSWTPPVSIIAPCRGVDEGLAENLSALGELDYPEFELLFVVDDQADPAVPVIEAVIGKIDRPAKLIVAAKAVNSGQKVENLREAILHVSDRSEIFVFVDSDARPAREWLRRLVAPLTDPHVGAATGYRWFISENPTVATDLLSAWNASIASALDPGAGSDFCWGGSMAMRRDIFERVKMRERWAGTVSDDFAVATELRAAKLPIIFVPQALTASFSNSTFRELVEFTTRQMKLTRVYAPKLWLKSLFGAALFNSVLLAAIFLIAFQRTNGLFVGVAIVTISSVIILGTAKAWLRLCAVRSVLTNYKMELGRQFWTQNTLWILTPVLFLWNSVAALFSRRITWRGITYELKSSRETVIIPD